MNQGWKDWVDIETRNEEGAVLPEFVLTTTHHFQLTEGDDEAAKNVGEGEGFCSFWKLALLSAHAKKFVVSHICFIPFFTESALRPI